MSVSGFHVDDVAEPTDRKPIAKRAQGTGMRRTIDVRTDVGNARKLQLHSRIEKAFVAAEGRLPNPNDSDFWNLYSEIEKGIVPRDLLPTPATGPASQRSGPGYSSSPFDTDRGAPQDIPVDEAEGGGGP